MNFKIEQTQLQSVINYLITKPYSEVYQLINTLMSLKKLEDQTGEQIEDGGQSKETAQTDKQKSNASD